MSVCSASFFIELQVGVCSSVVGKHAHRYALGTDFKLSNKFIEAYKDKYPDLEKLVKQWRFRYFKPFNITKAEQQ